MSKKLTQSQMLRIVMGDDNMRDEYEKRVQNANIHYSKNNLRVHGKKVGIQRFCNSLKFLASQVYEDFKQ
jgi:hypothetical protein